MGPMIMSASEPVQPVLQPPLFPPDVLEFTVRVGVVRSGDHAQIQYEVHDPIDGNLIRMESRHHVDARAIVHPLGQVLDRLYSDLHDFVWPFPD